MWSVGLKIFLCSVLAGQMSIIYRESEKNTVVENHDSFRKDWDINTISPPNI